MAGRPVGPVHWGEFCTRTRQSRNEDEGLPPIIAPSAIIQPGAWVDNNVTIGPGAFICSGAYIGHDTFVDADVTICANASIGGYCRIMKGAYIGMGAAVHQRKCIGSYSMLGMNTVVTKSLPVAPGDMIYGVPGRREGVNSVGMLRHGVGSTELELEMKLWHQLKTDLSLL